MHRLPIGFIDGGRIQSRVCVCFFSVLLGPEDIDLGCWVGLDKPSKPDPPEQPHYETLGLVPCLSAAPLSTALWWVPVLVAKGCLNKTPQPGGSNNKFLSYISGSPRSRCGQGGLSWGLYPWLANGTFLLSSCGPSSVCSRLSKCHHIRMPVGLD